MPQSTTSLTIIPSKFDRHVNRVRLQLFSGTKHAYLCGVALREAQADCLHGEWKPFLDVVGIIPRTAFNWIAAADRQFPNLSFEQVETKLENISDLPPLLTSGKSPRAAAHTFGG